MKRSIAGVLGPFILAAAGYAAEIPSMAELEIMHLLDYLSKSGCEFYRNGRWYGAEAARTHLEKKYGYLVKKQLIRNAEDFIARAATGSSMSGEAYQVRCGSNVSTSAAWLTAELIRLRQKQAPSP